MDLYANGGEKEGFEVILNNPGMPTAPAPAQSGMSYPGSRTLTDAHGGVVPLGAPSAARNAATYPDALVEPPLISDTHPAATWSGTAVYTDWLTAQLYSSSSGGRTPHQAVHDGAPYPDTDELIMAQLRSGAAPTAPWNAVECPDVLTAHLAAPDVSPASWNDVAYPAVAMALDTNALGYVTGQGAAADLEFERLRSTGAAAAATKRSGGGYYCYHHHSGDMAIPFSAQVVDEAADSDILVKDPAVAEQDEEVAAGEVAKPVPVRGGVAGQLGAAAITLAVAGLTAGGEVNPWTAVPLFLMLIAGVTVVTARVARG